MDSDPVSSLVEKFRRRGALVGVVGLGYVGLPLAMTFAEAGFRVLGLDVDAAKVERLRAGESYLETVSSQEQSIPPASCLGIYSAM